jgi:hypothetical protein
MLLSLAHPIGLVMRVTALGIPQVPVNMVNNVQSKLVEDCPKNGILETRVL